MKVVPYHITHDDDSLLTLIEPIESMPEELVETIDYPVVCFVESISDTDSNDDLLEFDF